MSIQDTQRFRDLARLLREQAALHDVTLMPAEAAELLADRISAVATQLRISERWALDRYFTADMISALAQTLATHAAAYREVTAATEPVTLDMAGIAHVIATLGMVLKLAAGNAEQTPADSMGIITDGADALVSLGAAISAAGGAPEISFGGQALTWTRTIIVQAIDLLRSGRWTCPCQGTHGPEPTCTLAPSLARDLNLVGGWLSPDST